MTLDEAIKHCEEVAYQKDLESEFETDNERYVMTDKERADCKECASEHRQLAEWLRELKELRKNSIGIFGRAGVVGVGCANCIHLKAEDYTKRPCGICCYHYSSKFEEVNADEGNSN